MPKMTAGDLKALLSAERYDALSEFARMRYSPRRRTDPWSDHENRLLRPDQGPRLAIPSRTGRETPRWLLLDPTHWWWKPNNDRTFCLELENVTAGSIEIRRQRLVTLDGQTITTSNYAVI
jgi:hypothetical protein